MIKIPKGVKALYKEKDMADLMKANVYLQSLNDVDLPDKIISYKKDLAKYIKALEKEIISQKK